METNIDVIQRGYDAFGRGDINGLLERTVTASSSSAAKPLSRDPRAR